MKKCSIIFIFLFMAGTASAQWVEQRFLMQTGWNAIHLSVQPDPADCDTIFAGTPIRRVLTYNDVFNTVQFITDPPTNFVPEAAMWLKWFAGTNQPVNGSLFQLRQGKSYLIESTNATPYTLVIKGRPELRQVEWRDNRFNMVGFMVDTSSPPSFASFFNPSPNHAGQRIYRMTNSIWVLTSSNALMRSGEAFWIYVTNGASTYQGPLAITEAPRSGLDFGNTLTEQALVLESVTGGVRSFTMTVIPSLASPTNHYPRAGEVPISWWDTTLGTLGSWRSFPSNGFTVISGSITGAYEAAHRFAVRRADFAPFTPPPGDLARYASVLEFKAASGLRQWIPITASGLKLPGESAVASQSHAGLWAGDVVVHKVSQATGYPNQTNFNATMPVPVGEGAEYQFRAIWHLDTNMQARLLPEAMIVWVDGSYSNNPQGVSSVSQPGKYVIVTGSNQVAQFTSAALSSDSSRGRRLTATAFNLDTPKDMNRGTNSAINTFSCTLPTSAGHTLNPTKHEYHRELGSGILNVSRAVSMEFLDIDTATAGSPEWGDRMLGGVWREQVTGLRHQTIHVEGRFILRKISDVSVLNQ